ncbi:mechanosensitive ion channel [Nocardiopsis sp. HNM0947]|uniref:Mechanosensitive ion channel n=2 Tax=Nocardiopsis coralli TaxID=2772213 RepID=A0ABR9P7C5_9ACTN|nr:mechanosensitive ion channel domain-containing protein [Nocardiopsis coralli]MBE2999740.1 mechanosensitive ion channel [Nocardiopsis coralli]
MDMAKWITLGVSIAVAVLLVAAAHWVLRHKLAKVWNLADFIVARTKVTAYTAGAVVGANLGLPSVQDVGWATYQTIDHVMVILMIAALTAFGITLAYAFTDSILARLDLSNSDADRRARRLQTQVRLLRRVITSIIVTLAVSAILFTFDEIQALGAGLLASAGVLGIVAGVAAQSTLGNLFAGLQLAFSDALRIGDVVVVEGEWGRVEELSLVNVTIKIWDERRLVVPVANFTTTSFENWTKQGTNITAKVQFPLDWEVPIAEMREEAGRIITASNHWDGRSWSCQIVDIAETGEIQVRVVATASHTDTQWFIACEIREHMIAWLAENYPKSLPRKRTEFVADSSEESGYASQYPTSAFRRVGAGAGAVAHERNGSPEGGDPGEA